MKYLLILLFTPSIGQVLPGFDLSSTKRYGTIDLNIKIDNCVKLVETESYINESFKGKIYIKEYQFTKAGTIKKLLIRDSGNNPIASFEFDKYRRVISSQENDSIISTYQYLDKKLKALSVTYAKKNLASKSIIQYNREIKPIRREYYKGKSTLSHSYFYEYNSNGDLIKEIFLNTPNGPGITIDLRDYKKIKPTPNDTINYIISYSSDTVKIQKKDRVESMTKKYLQGDTLINESITTFPSIKSQYTKIKKILNDLIIEEFHSDRINTVSTYLNTELISYKSYRDGILSKTDFYSYKFESDEFSNWTTKETYCNDTLIHKTDREIEYKKN